jgi:hypothetical protein
MTATRVPAIVVALAAKVNMTPIAWKEYPDRVVIVFEQGPKITFERETSQPAGTSGEIDLADGVNTTEAALAGKALQKRKTTSVKH